jgi:hypothetical protein
MVGERETKTAKTFLDDVAGRLDNRIQLTTDGHKMYFLPVAQAFSGKNVDYAQIVKVYGPDPEGEKRYRPAVASPAKRTPCWATRTQAY